MTTTTTPQLSETHLTSQLAALRERRRIKVTIQQAAEINLELLKDMSLDVLLDEGDSTEIRNHFNSWRAPIAKDVNLMRRDIRGINAAIEIVEALLELMQEEH